MGVTKETLRYLDSNVYKDVQFKNEPKQYIITDEDALDPGKICLSLGYPFDFWPILLKYNNIVDALAELLPGMTIYVPPLAEIQKLELTINE
jgi:hypothetical protein